MTPPTDSIGIENLARRLSVSNKEIKYYVGYFDRSSNRERGNREIYSNTRYSITDRKIILLDDVVTTGETMEKCKLLLLNAGDEEVKCITLGRTWRNIEAAYYKLEEAYNLENRKDDEKFLLGLIDILQESTNILRDLRDCSNDNQAMAYEIGNKIQDDLKLLYELRHDSGSDLGNYEGEAHGVINGNDTFHSSNILQKVFLW